MNLWAVEAIEARYLRNGERQRANADDVLMLRQAAADWLAVRRVHRIKTGE